MTQQAWTRYEEIWSSDDFEARERFAEFEELPKDLILDILSSEGDLGILCALGANKYLPNDLAWKMFNYEYALTIDEDPELMVHRGLARNTSSPLDLLNELSKSSNEEIAEIARESLDRAHSGA